MHSLVCGVAAPSPKGPEQSTPKRRIRSIFVRINGDARVVVVVVPIVSSISSMLVPGLALVVLVPNWPHANRVLFQDTPSAKASYAVGLPPNYGTRGFAPGVEMSVAFRPLEAVRSVQSVGRRKRWKADMEGVNSPSLIGAAPLIGKECAELNKAFYVVRVL